MAKSELHFLGHKVDLITVETNYSKLFDERKNAPPALYNQGGLLKLVFDLEGNFRFLERMLTINYDLYKLGYPVDEGKIVFYDANDDNLKTWTFKDAPVVDYNVKFDANGGGIRVKVILSPAIQDYGHKINRSWHITPIEEEKYQSPVQEVKKKDKKPFRINIKATNNDIENGLFGFDTIPKKKIVTSNYEKLKKEYKPLSKKILDEQYIPSWLSIRKNQTVELELNWNRKTRAKEYHTIAFDEHPDFTFKPKNLKDAKTVKITCKNNNAATTQITIKADDNLIVGALNIFYPKPKKIKLKWAIAEFNEDEFNNIKEDFFSSKLQEYFKKALNPALIDIVIENKKPYEINIPILETITSTSKDKIIKAHITRMRKHMSGTKKVISTKSDEQSFATNLYHIAKHNNNLNNNEAVVLILTSLKCSRVNKDNLPSYVNGFSLTGKGISAMALGNTKSSSSAEIPHEIMHAICLEHTFNIDSGFEILKGSTDNYMDYENTKKHTYKWQWEKLHKSKYSHEI